MLSFYILKSFRIHTLSCDALLCMQGALLSRLMVAGQGRGPAGAPRATAAPLLRSSLAMGSTPLER